jgi:hypothetical protein
MSQSPSLPPSVLNGPALRPPPGEVPNFEHAWNLNDVAEIANVICLVATTFAILVRAYAKAFCQKKMELEDGKFPSTLILWQGEASLTITRLVILLQYLVLLVW